MRPLTLGLSLGLVEVVDGDGDGSRGEVLDLAFTHRLPGGPLDRGARGGERPGGRFDRGESA